MTLVGIHMICARPKYGIEALGLGRSLISRTLTRLAGMPLLPGHSPDESQVLLVAVQLDVTN